MEHKYPKKVVRGKGRLSGLTFGIGEPRHTTNVVGASILSVDWNIDIKDEDVKIEGKHAEEDYDTF